MKIELHKFDRSENLGINERFNLTKNVLAFPIRATCTATCRLSAVALQLIKL